MLGQQNYVPNNQNIPPNYFQASNQNQQQPMYTSHQRMPQQSQYGPQYAPQQQQLIQQQQFNPQVQFSDVNYVPVQQQLQPYQILPQYVPNIQQLNNQNQNQYQPTITQIQPPISVNPALNPAELAKVQYAPNLQNQPFHIVQPTMLQQDKHIPCISQTQKSPTQEYYNVKSKTFYEFLVFGFPKTASQIEVQQELMRQTGVHAEFLRQVGQGLIFQVERSEELIQIYERTPFAFNNDDKQLCGVTKEPSYIEEMKFQQASSPARQVPFIGFWVSIISLFVIWGVLFGKDTTTSGIIYLAISLIITLMISISIGGYWLIKK